MDRTPTPEDYAFVLQKGCGCVCAAILILLLLAWIGKLTSKPAYTPAQFNGWLAGMQATANVKVPGTSLEWRGEEPGHSLVATVRLPMTPRQARDLSQALASFYLSAFPKESGVVVRIEDYDTMKTLHFEIWSRPGE